MAIVYENKPFAGLQEKSGIYYNPGHSSQGLAKARVAALRPVGHQAALVRAAFG
jgi:hypothetical protein